MKLFFWGSGWVLEGPVLSALAPVRSSAARAALDLTGAENLTVNTRRPPLISRLTEHQQPGPITAHFSTMRPDHRAQGRLRLAQVINPSDTLVANASSRSTTCPGRYCASTCTTSATRWSSAINCEACQRDRPSINVTFIAEPFKSRQNPARNYNPVNSCRCKARQQNASQPKTCGRPQLAELDVTRKIE